MSEYWGQGLYEIPVVGHPVRRIYSYFVIMFMIKHGRCATKLLFFIQKSLNSMDQHEIFHLGGRYLTLNRKCHHFGWFSPWTRNICDNNGKI